jgi:TonB family protein
MTDSTASYEQHIEAARLAHGRGDRAGIEQALQSAVRTAEGLPDGHLKLVAALIKLGEVKHAAGDSAEAESLFRRALDIGESVLGQDDLGLVPPLTSLGALRISRGAPEEAEPLLTRALAISERTLGRDHPDLVVLLNDLSRHYLKQSAYGFAEPLLLQLYSIKRTKGEDHPEVATVLASLAAVRQALGRHDAAEQLWRRVLDIRERTLAPNHFATATAIEHLAETCAARGKLSEALRLYQRALAMRELTLGAGHPSLRVSRERIADLQLQGSEESFGPGSGLLPGLSDWRMPSTSDLGATSGDAVDLSFPVTPRLPEPESRPAAVRTPEPAPIAAPRITPVPAPIAAQKREASAPAVGVAPAVRPIVTPPVELRTPAAPTPVVAAPVMTSPPAPAPAAAPAVDAVAVRAPEARPAFTPDSDARKVAAPTQQPHPEYAPEIGDDEEAPSALRLFAVGGAGQPGSSLVMPSFAGELASIEEELAQQDEDALLGNRARSVAASAVAAVRAKPMPAIAAGLGVAAIAIYAMTAGFRPQSDSLSPRPIEAQQTQQIAAVAPVNDSAAGSIVGGGASDGAPAERNAPTTTASSERPVRSATSDESSSRSAPKTTTPERTSAPASPAAVPDLPRNLAAIGGAQLDSAMRAAGRSTASSSESLVRPAVTFAPGLLERPTNDRGAAKSTQPALIGEMPRIAYPQALRAKGREVQGQVLVEFSVDTLGRPDMSTLSVLQSDHELFTAAVRKAIPSMRFVPALENGRKARGLVTKQFRFAIDR